MENEKEYQKLVSKYKYVSDIVKEIINHCNSKKFATSDLSSMIVLLEDLEQKGIFVEDSDIEFERKVLGLLEFEMETMSREYEQLKNSILELANGISNISENKNLPILLNILMDGIGAYNSMISRQSNFTDSMLEMSFWSIELMDTIYATNGGMTTLLDYTLEKIQDQFPSILNTFDEINYLDKFSTRYKISEIYRGLVRLNFGLDQRIKSLEEMINKRQKSRNKSKAWELYNREEVLLKINNLRELSDFLKYEFISLIKDILFFSKYLGIDDEHNSAINSSHETDTDSIKGSYDDLISEIETVCEIFQNGQVHKTREIMDRIISNLDVEEFEEILGAFNLLNWLKGRVSICLGRNLENNIEEISAICSNKQQESSSSDLDKDDERLLNHQETRYYDED
ncbi:hypothetical protein CPHLJ_3g1500 [Cryptosporidium parvum]|nr:Uncharacterized protein CPATCC_0032460 [Cryptosporidium parvum]WKS76892.1 hypothetical protein CPCDC_3g1500 [Cryptosporidium sp. 43IA8]WRK31384.1 Uncharacterized protein cpbgf_3001500 [Cryptosporidium parvum]|eukprot:QOY42499.1 hypothetical protein CPATCC_001142 [Cryptosporidium parvum]